MKTLLAIALAGLALSACAPRYYDDRTVSDRYFEPRGDIEYTDRDRTNDPYYAGDNDEVRRHYRDYHEHY
jgi:hypothetical protein